MREGGILLPDVGLFCTCFVAPESKSTGADCFPQVHLRVPHGFGRIFKVSRESHDLSSHGG
jgi:hypothetical protein